MREVQDHYFRQAKREGYRSRAAYKLIEIDDRKCILQRGDRVLDLGAAPGSWLQVAAERIGERGVAVGVDLQPIQPGFAMSNIVTIEADIHEIDAQELRAAAAARQGIDGSPPFDVVVSDMAPSTTGDPTRDHFLSVRLCEALLERLPQLLREGGACVIKAFEGEQYPALLSTMKARFERVKGFKPRASRSESVEMYIIGQGYRPASEPTPAAETPARERRPRPRGWQ